MYKDLRAGQLKIRNRNKQYLLEYLQKHPCIMCGESDPVVLEFDHIDSSTKLQDVSAMATKMHFSLKRIIEEIAKCQVLCCNCHRRKTHPNRLQRIDK